MRLCAFHCLPVPCQPRRGSCRPPSSTRRPVTRDGDVGNQADEEEEHRDRQVGVDREDVPQERALEVHPQNALVRVGQQEVELPEPPDVDQREQRRGEHGEDRHRLGAAVDRVAPLRSEEEEDRRDQRAGVADTDPEHEGDDVDAPEDGRLVTGDAQTVVGLVDQSASCLHDAGDGEQQRDQPGQ